MVPSIPFSKWTKGSGRTFGNYENDTKVTKKPFPYFEGTVSTFLKKLKGTVSTFLKKFPQNLFCKKKVQTVPFSYLSYLFRTFLEPFDICSDVSIFDSSMPNNRGHTLPFLVIFPPTNSIYYDPQL